MPKRGNNNLMRADVVKLSVWIAKNAEAFENEPKRHDLLDLVYAETGVRVSFAQLLSVTDPLGIEFKTAEDRTRSTVSFDASEIEARLSLLEESIGTAMKSSEVLQQIASGQIEAALPESLLNRLADVEDMVLGVVDQIDTLVSKAPGVAATSPFATAKITASHVRRERSRRPSNLSSKAGTPNGH
jgi:hypothetical protein